MDTTDTAEPTDGAAATHASRRKPRLSWSEMAAVALTLGLAGAGALYAFIPSPTPAVAITASASAADTHVDPRSDDSGDESRAEADAVSIVGSGDDVVAATAQSEAPMPAKDRRDSSLNAPGVNSVARRGFARDEAGVELAESMSSGRRRTTLRWDDWYATRVIVDQTARTLEVSRVPIFGDFVAVVGNDDVMRELIPDHEFEGAREFERVYVVGGHEVVLRFALGGPDEDVVHQRGTGMVTLSLSFDGVLRMRGHLQHSAADYSGNWTFSSILVDIHTHTLNVTATEGGGVFHLTSGTIGYLRSPDPWIIWASDFAEGAARDAEREAQDEEAERLKGEDEDASAIGVARPAGLAPPASGWPRATPGRSVSDGQRL